MAPHELETFEDGSTAFFSNRQTPWHQLGVVTDRAQTAQEALQIAQLDSTVYVSENPACVNINGTNVQVSNRFITYRDHPQTGLTGLGVVGARYTPIQNVEAFDFLNALSDESGAVFETAGSLNSGRRVFVTMRFPNSMTLGGVDLVDNYVMAVNSHDATLAFTVAITPVRAVCTNTVRLALRNAKAKLRLRHTANATQKVQQARETLNIVWKYQEEFQKQVENMLSSKMSDSQFTEFVEKLIPAPTRVETSQRQLNTVEDTRGRLQALWNAPTQQNIKGTAWAAYNAVAEYEDWARPIRNKDNQDYLRAQRIVNGSAEGLKVKAQTLLHV